MDPNLWQTLGELVVVLGQLVVGIFLLAANWLLVIAWIAWWLLAVNWRKAWPVLARGGWAPLILVTIFAAFEWSRLQPGPWEWPGVLVIPAFWWELLCVTALVLVAILCGWLQGVLNWAPPELNLNPPVHTEGHAHAHH